MTISLSCRRCNTVFTADDEDELVSQVQTHAHDEHDAHPSREHILAHLHDQDHPRQTEPDVFKRLPED